MTKSFYHYMMKHRHIKPNNEIEIFANELYEDTAFPRQSFHYDEVSRYLEENMHYATTLTIFDQAWEMYKEDK